MDTPKPININGFDTFYIEADDSVGKCLLILVPKDANNSISDICGDFINGHFIKQIDYAIADDGSRFMKAYY